MWSPTEGCSQAQRHHRRRRRHGCRRTRSPFACLARLAPSRKSSSAFCAGQTGSSASALFQYGFSCEAIAPSFWQALVNNSVVERRTKFLQIIFTKPCLQLLLLVGQEPDGLGKKIGVVGIPAMIPDGLTDKVVVRREDIREHAAPSGVVEIFGIHEVGAVEIEQIAVGRDKFLQAFAGLDARL